MRNAHLPHRQSSEDSLRVMSGVFLRDGPHQRKPRWLKALCWRFWIVIENFFQAYDPATAAQAAHERARVRDRKASSTIDRVSQRNAADAPVSGKFEEFRHRGFSLPSLGPPLSIAVVRFERWVPPSSIDGF
jgi:hypothetical protein